VLAKVGGLMALGATSDPSGLARTLRDPHAVADPVPTLLHDRVIQPMASDLKTILELELPIIVRLAEKPMRIDDVLDWVPGCIVDLSTDAESELDLLINTPIHTGSATEEGRWRVASIQVGIPLITTLAGARAAVGAIRALRANEIRASALQDYLHTTPLPARGARP